MSKAELTPERLRELLHYDAETGFFRWRQNVGRRTKAGELAGCWSRDGYEKIGIDGKKYKAHRLAWLYVHGEWPSYKLKHANRLANDNRIGNLVPRNMDFLL